MTEEINWEDKPEIIETIEKKSGLKWSELSKEERFSWLMNEC